MDRLATTFTMTLGGPANAALRAGRTIGGALLTDKAGETTLASIVLYAAKEACDGLLEAGAATAVDLLLSGVNALASL